jgi:hypothetical protein
MISVKWAVLIEESLIWNYTYIMDNELVPK